MPTKFVLLGASGRVGSKILEVTEDSADWSCVGKVTSKTTISGFEDSIKNSDVLIDFTGHDISAKWMRNLLEANTLLPMVTGSTGWTDETWETLKLYSASAPILFGSNMSIGANLLFGLSKIAARALDEVGGYDPEILESHHKNKVDAPSGTAITLAENVVSGFEKKFSGKDLKDVANYHREGITGKRDENELGIQTLRGGSVIGEHTIYYYGDGEQIEISHRALDRSLFAKGALKAASWLKNQPNGLYSMQDVLGLKI